MQQYAVFWFRRDLRFHDNTGLFHALSSGLKVIPLFIFDKLILQKLHSQDARVNFIYEQILRLNNDLQGQSTGLHVYYGEPLQIWVELLKRYPIKQVYFNEDYEPYARERDLRVRDLMESHGISVQGFKDQVIFEKDEVLSNTGTVYTVFTPYAKKWKAQLKAAHLAPNASAALISSFADLKPDEIPTLTDMGFDNTNLSFPTSAFNKELILQYGENRNFPSLPGTSRLGVHLRFGTISIREIATKALEWSETFLNELIWREFYMQILWNFPYVAEGPFKKDYAAIPWVIREDLFEKWKTGKTGFALVDAGMRELNETGFMHNRVRMVCASFLVKDLLIDWRWGEAYFAEKLLDFELSSNNGGWQWAAGCGTDAAPYFRIFNPVEQQKKFDPQGKYIRKWVPEYGTPAYPAPMIDHKIARERTLAVFKAALSGQV